MSDVPWIQTYTGRAVPLIDPQPEHIHLPDIAHHLAALNRFTGATHRPYSVAQHSVLVARRAGGWDGQRFNRIPEARFGLLHDGSEAYLGDVSSPLKSIIRSLYEPLEQGFLVAIMLKFGVELTPEIEEAVKRADLELLASEKRDLLNQEPRPWNLPYEAPREYIEPAISRSAEVLFLKTFKQLFPEHGA